MTVTKRLKREIEEYLTNTGRSWEIRQGKKHMKIFLEGKFIAVFNHGKHGNDADVIIAIIRRHIRDKAA